MIRPASGQYNRPGPGRGKGRGPARCSPSVAVGRELVPRGKDGAQLPMGQTRPVHRPITVVASIEEYRPWFHDLTGETRVRCGRSLWGFL